MDKWVVGTVGAGLVVTCVTMLSACGGGGGGSGNPSPAATITGNGFAPTTGPGDTSAYFPAAAGDQWLFNASTSNSGAASTFEIGSLAVNGTKSVQGTTATVFTTTDTSGQSASVDQYFAFSNGGITALGNTNPGDTISPLIIPYVQQLFPVQIGQVSAVSASNLPAGTDPSGHPVTLSLTQTITNGDFETVEVPAGVFANALNQSTTINATVFDNGQSAPITGTENTWYVAGVGEIKDVTSTSGAGKTITGSAELRGYTVNGIQHGFGAIETLAGSLAPSGCQSAPYAGPAVGSDGTNFLIVAHQCAVASGTATWNWFGTLVGPAGATISTISITAPGSVSGGSGLPLHAAVAFDGTNYLVVFQDDSSSQGQTNVDGVLISPTGTLVTAPANITTEGRTGDPHSYDLALAFDGSRYLLVYIGYALAFTPPPVAGLFITPGTGQASGTAFTISATPAFADTPAVAFDGTNYLAVWADNTTAPLGLYAARISTAGAILDATPIQIVDGSTPDLFYSCCDFAPAVSYGGGSYLIAYRDPRGEGSLTQNASISAARVSTAGVLVDGSATSPGIVVTASKGNPKGRVRSVFFGGSHLLIWETDLPLGLAAARVAPATGAVSANWPEGFTLVPATDTIGFPAIGTSSGGAYLAWLNGTTSPISVTALGGLPIFSSGP
jgi:hypothetical protein